MTANAERIPLQVDVRRIIEVLATQIYQSPLALLRENTQNAFDAILLRQHQGGTFEPRIDLTISPSKVTVSDNGIGMTSADLRGHFWRAGSSSKNNPDARAAGVVGTFGIGAMANFGIAERLTVTTESTSGQRTRSEARRSELSTTDDCISLEPQGPKGEPGTIIEAEMQPETQVNVDEATSYISAFVRFAPVPVYVNGNLVSQNSFDAAVRLSNVSWDHRYTWHQLAPTVHANAVVSCSANGELSVSLDIFTTDGEPMKGRIILLQGVSSLQTFRSGFGLATTGISSAYQFGGIADLVLLEPTAGREALSTGSMQFLQSIVSAVDALASEAISGRPESDLNTNFMGWAAQHSRFDLCGKLKMRVEPGDRTMPLAVVAERSSKEEMSYYPGSNADVIQAYASEDKPLLVAATRNPRRACEDGYVRNYCHLVQVTDNPQVLNVLRATDLSPVQLAVLYRLQVVVEQDYFLASSIRLGKISHSLPILVNADAEPIEITLDPEASSLSVLIGVYDTEFAAFGSMAKDFVRNAVFPHISKLVPSSTRQGADAFLKSISRHREIFQYEARDREELGAIWEGYLSGEITFEEATRRSTNVARLSVDVVTPASTRTITEVVPDLIENEVALQVDGEQGESGPLPPISRLELETDAKLLTISAENASLKGYRCFLALAESTARDKGEFFHQPHSTSVVWGGQKVLFVFQHHSGEFGLYYDVQAEQLVAEKSGGGVFPTCTILLRNRIFIPIPEEIAPRFIPTGDERKRLEIRSDLLYIESGPAASDNT